MSKDSKFKLDQYYDSKIDKGCYGEKAVYLNPDPNHYHQRILKIIKEESKNKELKILDVGCATGFLGAAVKMDKNYVCGVEISQKAAKKAKKVLDDVVVENIEEVRLPYPQEYFDVIICSDVIEHLFDPRSALTKLRKYLKPSGKILVVVPNVAWIGLRLSLLIGRWEYKDYGIMDYGHIRWFTKRSIIRLLSESGYEVEKIIPYIPRKITRLLGGSKIAYSLAKLWGSLIAYEFLIIAKKIRDSTTL